ncbi:Lipid-translocating exporter-like protein rta1 [Emmonsiellopsis sp. PD_5]|nr:Lipid-translocating exporter-like protein rta1 [Emmonsiellopsis sp. PD_5]
MPELTAEDLYHYSPNKGVAIFFAVAYALSAALHEMQYRSSKPQKFTIPLTMGAIFSTVGFVQRALIASGTGNPKTLFIFSTMFILGAGPTYAGADYFICGRVFSFIPSAAPISPLRTVRTFITFDVLAEICVWAGASLLAGAGPNGATRYKIGLNLIRVAMITQTVLFLSFVAVLAVFHLRVRRLKAKWDASEGGTQRRFMTVVYCLYASSILIITRSAYHIAESFVPEKHTFRTTEPPFLVCEGAVMLLNTAMFNLFHPGHILPIDSRVYMDLDGEERESDAIGGALSDPRPLRQKILDPLDIKGLLAKKKDRSYEPRDRVEMDDDPSRRLVSAPS